MKKMGRPISETGIYAREMFPSLRPHDALKRIRAAGGPTRLKALTPESRRLILGIK